jgi:hypothetical protein
MQQHQWPSGPGDGETDPRAVDLDKVVLKFRSGHCILPMVNGEMLE